MPKRRMTFKKRSRRKKTKFVTRREFPLMLMKLAEPKRVDAFASNVSLSDNLPINDLDFSVMGEGTAINQRVGMVTQVTGFFGRLTFSNFVGEPDQNTNQAYYARVVLYTPREDTFPDLDVTPVELLNPQEIIVWQDKIIAIPWTNGVGPGIIHIGHKWSPYMKVNYSSSGSGTAQNNRVKVAISTDCQNPAQVECSYGLRLFYRDV